MTDEPELARGTTRWSVFLEYAEDVLLYPNDSRHERSGLAQAVLWPDHMRRALNAIGQAQDGPRPRQAWVELLHMTMRKDGASP